MSDPEPDEPAVAPPDDGVAAPPAKPTRMLAKEQQIGWGIVAVTAGAVLAAHAGPALRGNSTALGQGAVGLGLAVLMAAAIWYGHRIWAAFASLVAGFVPLTPRTQYLAFFALGFGAFLMFRVSREQAKARAASGGTSRPRGGRTRADTATGRRGRTAAAGTGDAGRPAGRPSANRRYTPPKSRTSRRGR